MKLSASVLLSLLIPYATAVPACLSTIGANYFSPPETFATCPKCSNLPAMEGYTQALCTGPDQAASMSYLSSCIPPSCGSPPSCFVSSCGGSSDPSCDALPGMMACIQKACPGGSENPDYVTSFAIIFDKQYKCTHATGEGGGYLRGSAKDEGMSE